MIESNIKQVNSELEKLYKKSVSETSKLVREITTGLVNALKRASPVDTGNLRDNWNERTISEVLKEISNNTEYIFDTEYGRKSPHRGWIEKTLNRAIPDIEKAIQKKYKEMFK